ncbi:MAG: acyl-CoA dehydrogenase family protein [Acidimicrobiales bacterium]
MDTETVRAEVRRWLADAWDPTITVGAWWARLADSGWGMPGWPSEWSGRSLDERGVAAVREEMVRAGVLGPPSGAGPLMAAPVILAYGSDDQRRRWLRSLARGEEHWCQFFSEPDAGSDLAGVKCRAVRDGDEWVVNGQKVWNSGTLLADRGILLARTDPSAPKHRGLSFFVIDVDQPGIEIRPIRQMNDRTEFNETFFTDARVGDDAMVGNPGDGWRAALATLSNERANFAGGGDGDLVTVEAGRRAGNLVRRVGDVLAEAAGATEMGGANTPPVSTPADLVELARRHDRDRDPLVRQRIAAVRAASEALRLNGLRAAAVSAAGGEPGAERSVNYLGAVRVLREVRDLAGAIVGPAATLMGPGAPDAGDVAMTIMTVPCHGIQGGSEQIQMNILGERVLGLPKEPQVDRDAPFQRPPPAGADRSALPDRPVAD